MSFVSSKAKFLLLSISVCCGAYGFHQYSDFAASSSILNTRTITQMTAQSGETRSSYQEIWEDTHDWLISSIAPSQSRVVISKAETVPGVISDFWRYTHQMSEHMRMGTERQSYHLEEHIYFVMPDCTVVNDEKAMDKVVRLLSASHQAASPSPAMSCHLTHYHPNLTAKTNEKSGTPAPYPTLGIHLKAWPVQTQGSGAKVTRSSDSSKNINKVLTVQKTLERIYNQPAAKSITERLQGNNEHLPTGLPQTSMEALQHTIDWVERRVKREQKQQAPDPRMINLQSIFRHTVSTSECADEALADTWNEIEEIVLRANGIGCDNKQKKLFIPVKAQSIDDSIDDSELLDPCFSSLLILPNFNSFNAYAFKKFIANLSALLAAAPLDEQFHIEMFHPEYVTANGKVEVGRRMPYPAIHIYYTGIQEEEGKPNYSAGASAVFAQQKDRRIDYNTDLFRQEMPSVEDNISMQENDLIEDVGSDQQLLGENISLQENDLIEDVESDQQLEDKNQNKDERKGDC